MNLGGTSAGRLSRGDDEVLGTPNPSMVAPQQQVARMVGPAPVMDADP